MSEPAKAASRDPWPWVTRAALLAGATLALSMRAPPAPVPASAPDDAFSAERAMAHLETIAAAPRPTGSAQNAEVRRYLVTTLAQLGLSASVQRNERPPSDRVPKGVLHNVIGVLPGTDREARAVMVAAHYDSVAAGPGASDDGAAVAAMLETARALRAAGPLRRDVVFLITDAEEVGLVGARAFVEAHPLAARAGVVLNFEARGSRGPLYMFETSGPTAWLAGALAKTSRRPFATSMAVEVYRRMPNLTDFTVFSEAGMRGMNFAYIDGLADYHTAHDDLEQLDRGSLQHHGETMLALVRHFAAEDLESPPSGEAVYFDVAGRVLVRWPAWLAKPLAILSCVALAAAAWHLVRGARRRVAALSFGISSGALAIATSAVVATAAGALAYATWGPSVLDRPRACFVALAAIGLASWGASHFVFVKPARGEVKVLMAAALVWHAALALATAWLAPGASYLFLLTTLTGSALLALGRGAALGPTWKAAVIRIAVATPAVLVLVQTAEGLFVALPEVPAASAILVALSSIALGPALVARAATEACSLRGILAR